MTFRDDHLRALLACVDEGSFDGAAAVLHLTPSAVSQRIKALETHVGDLVLTRTQPTRVTDTGAILLRNARMRDHLDRELNRELQRGGSRGVVDFPIALNADSLATWFGEVLETASQWSDVRLRLFIEDQDHSARLLRESSVIGAVTASSRAVQGCSVRELGVMRYRPLITETLWQACGERLENVPTIRFNDRDDLQRRVLRSHGLTQPAVEHVIPSAQGFSAAIRAGLGWGMVPQGLDDAGLMRMPGLEDLDIPLYWQSWKLSTPALARLSDEIIAAAHQLY